MARRSKASPADVFIEIASRLPWWVSLVLAAISYLALHAYANQPPEPVTPGRAADGIVPAFLKGLAFAGQFILPILFAFAAVLSFLKRASPKPKQPTLSASKPPNSKIANSAPSCPACSGQMVMRSAKKGSNAGTAFWGCSNYPRCKGTRVAN
jgi:restriction system protein